MTKDDQFLCHDCKLDTNAINEYYMVANSIWNSVAQRDLNIMLCIGCLEERLGRRLNTLDFALVPVNIIALINGSPRLRSRIDQNLNVWVDMINTLEEKIK